MCLVPSRILEKIFPKMRSRVASCSGFPCLNLVLTLGTTFCSDLCWGVLGQAKKKRYGLLLLAMLGHSNSWHAGSHKDFVLRFAG